MADTVSSIYPLPTISFTAAWTKKKTSSSSSSSSSSTSTSSSKTTTKKTTDTSDTITASNKYFSYTQTTRDVLQDSVKNRRDIGSLTDNKSTLIVKSTLGPTSTSSGVKVNNKVDYYKFTVTASLDDAGIVAKAQNTKGSTVSSVDVAHDVGLMNIQILNSQGEVIADSSSSATKTQKDNYAALRENKLSLDKGTYTMRVAFTSGAMSSKTSPYAIQLVAGTTYSKSYTTTQYAPESITTSASASATSTALDIIDASKTTTGYNLPSTGTIFDYTS